MMQSYNIVCPMMSKNSQTIALMSFGNVYTLSVVQILVCCTSIDSVLGMSHLWRARIKNYYYYYY